MLNTCDDPWIQRIKETSERECHERHQLKMFRDINRMESFDERIHAERRHNKQR